MSSKLRKRNARKNWITSIIVASFLVSSAGCSLLPNEDRMIKPDLVKPVESMVVTKEAKVGDIIKLISGTGTFQSHNTAEHFFTVTGGRVKDVYFFSGDLVKKGDILMRLETEGLDMDLLRSQLDFERKKLALTEARAAGNSSRIKIASLDYDISKKLLDKVQSLISNNILIAKLDGIVTFSAAKNVGDVVETHSTLFTIADPNEIKLSYSTSSQENLRLIQIGMIADIKMGTELFKGTVVQTPSSAPDVDDKILRETYARTVYIDMESIPDKVQIGDSAAISIVTDTREDVVVIPLGGVQKNFGRTYVQVVDGEERTDIDVEVGLESATEVEIVKGLEAGQIVIIK